MYCSNCGTQYEVTSLEPGKSKFCRSCGIVLYKNLNNSIIFNPDEIPLSAINLQKTVETEQNLQEQLLRERQLEIEKERQAASEKLQEEEMLRQKQLELKQKQEIEAEQKRQLEIELEKKRQIEIQQQQEIILLRKRETEIQQEKKSELKELRKILDQEKELELKKLREELLKDSQTKPEQFIEPVVADSSPKSPAIKFIITTLLSLAIGAAGYYLADKFILSKINEPASNNAAESPKAPAALSPEKIKSDLSGKNITGWGVLEINHITSILSNIRNTQDSTFCTSNISLSDNLTKAKASVILIYTDTILVDILTDKISFENIAPANAWFSFEPVSDCAIWVNTNNNPIQIKACENCVPIKMNTNAETLQKLANHPQKIFITSDTQYESVIEFTYIPEK